MHIPLPRHRSPRLMWHTPIPPLRILPIILNNHPRSRQFPRVIRKKLPPQYILLIRYSLRLEHSTWLLDFAVVGASVWSVLLHWLCADEDLGWRNVLHYLVPAWLLADAVGSEEHFGGLPHARWAEVAASHDEGGPGRRRCGVVGLRSTR